MADETEMKNHISLKLMGVLDAWNREEIDAATALRCLQDLRGRTSEAAKLVDEVVLKQLYTMHAGLVESRENIDQIQGLIDQYAAAPLIPAVYLHPEETRLGDMAVVTSGGARRAVAIGDAVDTSSLTRGAQIYLSADMSVLVATSSDARSDGSDLAQFERFTSDGRVMIRLKTDEQLVVDAAADLNEQALEFGDTVRWDRAARICVEKMADGVRSPYLLEAVEDIPLSSIGGQKQNLSRIREALLLGLLHPELARQYRVPCSNSLLLYGPPGNGKTSMTRAVFSEIQRISGRKVLLAVVKASQWESMWVGQTSANISALFAEMRKASEAGNIAVLFIDEIDAVGRIRGSQTGHHSDKALGTLLTEMNGFKEVENVSIVAACNRKDLLDPALTSRFGEELLVRRPDMLSAREIFSIHLEEALPFAEDAVSSVATRAELIDCAVSRLYAPNAGNEVCTLKLRDGKTRTISAAALVSGRLIQQISLIAKKRAIHRVIANGPTGLKREDMEVAISEALERMATLLTPHNAHSYLETLGEDEQVVAVEPIRRRVDRPMHYLHIA